MLSNKEFRASARQALTNNWGTAVAVSFVFICTYIFLSLIASIPDFLGDAIDKIIPRYSDEEALVNTLSASSIMLDLLSLIFDILLFPIEWGICILFLGFYRGGSLTFEGLFAGFTGGRYGRTLYTYFLNFVRVLLWSLLFIVPGIMKFYSYAMLPYILKDYPDLNAPQVLAMSRKMMDGRRWQLFLLHLSFIGWFLLALLTCGIGLFWLHPYVALSEIAFYENARAEYEAEQGGEAPLQANE